MSFTHVPAIWANGPDNPTQKFVLLALADYANDEGGDIWPEIKTVAQKCGLSEATVIRAINGLVKNGFLIRKRRRSTSNMYQIVVERFSVSVNLTDTNSVSVNLTPRNYQNDSLETVKLTHDPIPINQSTNNNNQPPLQTLRDHFVQRTTIQPNEQTGTYERNWEKPLAAILEKARGDPVAAVALIDAALDVAWGKNDSGRTYPVASPKSIATIAANLAVSSKATATAADDETIWQRALQAITRKEYSDERLKAAIRAVGFDRIARANGHDADQLRKQLGNEYRSNIRNTAPA